MTLHHGDCLEVMATMPDASVDAIVTDPPYDLTANKKGGTGVASVNLDSPYGRARIGTGNGAGGFMGKAWDGTGIAFRVETWAEMLRVAKPGAHLIAFGGTRTYHRMAVAIEDAGWEIRDELVWIYASGFPKSLDVSKALDKVAGAEREVVGSKRVTRILDPETLRRDNYTVGTQASGGDIEVTAPATDLARQWEGWGTALKPAHEPIVLARKPLVGTVAANVTRYGTGALNIDGSRIGNGDGPGRWPSNVLLQDAELFDVANPGVVGSGATTTSGSRTGEHDGSGAWSGPFGKVDQDIEGDVGGYSRFFLVPKAPRHERMVNGQRGTHPTQKPVDLMRHLLKLVTPPGGMVLDPFLGSGTTAIAAEMEGFAWIGIEREAEYVAIAEARLNGTQRGLGLDFGPLAVEEAV